MRNTLVVFCLLFITGCSSSPAQVQDIQWNADTTALFEQAYKECMADLKDLQGMTNDSVSLAILQMLCDDILK